MAINGIQFQKGMSLAQFMKEYGTEEQCEAALVKARWRDGFECPRCAHRLAYEFKRGATRYWQCKACRYQTSLRAGTVMEHGHLPLTTWFLAIYLMTQSKTNIAALALMRHLGVSWKAAWLLKHKLMEVMVQREAGQPLQGEVRADDAYLGGERTGSGPGRGSSNKMAFVAAVELREGRPQRVRFDPVDGFSFAALTPWAKCAIAPGSCVVTDGLLGFEVLERLGYTHKVVLAPRGKAGTEIEPFKWLNVVLGNLKTALSGTHHAFKFAKYARRYLAEVQYRFNRRFDMAAMLPRMAVAVTHTRPCPRRKLLGKSEAKT
ncbi:IS1595 family transposase [Duganella sp. LjRoot269]|uniref:IS1595 family transposase n=1 Tax=Duganella sp. LjRoot269 TaxID=3342305 RepID=UPI003ECE40D1